MEALAERALRTLAVARRDLDPDEPIDDVEALLHDLEPLGLVALMDPLRPTAADTIAAARRAGMGVVMMTGDHIATAAAIAADAGIEGRAIEGRDVRRMSDDELDEAVADLGVVARVAPDDKLRLVQAFQRRGEWSPSPATARTTRPRSVPRRSGSRSAPVPTWRARPRTWSCSTTISGR